MMVGLQGSGKTATTAKIAEAAEGQGRKKVLMASLDVESSTAQEQLAVLGSQIDVATLPIIAGQQPVGAQRAMQAAKLQGFDVLMLDTAGRLHVDQQLMDEMQAVSRLANPAGNAARRRQPDRSGRGATAFTEQVPLTGVVLTRMDGDARGGAALSMRAVTGKPIKFAGTGELTVLKSSSPRASPGASSAWATLTVTSSNAPPRRSGPKRPRRWQKKMAKGSNSTSTIFARN